jgi:hypothetical protein
MAKNIDFFESMLLDFNLTDQMIQIVKDKA